MFPQNLSASLNPFICSISSQSSLVISEATAPSYALQNKYTSFHGNNESAEPGAKQALRAKSESNHSNICQISLIHITPSQDI